jgi:signal transduction histidine kinase
MDLHDGIMQEIYGAGLTLELALEDLSTDTEACREGVSRAIEQLHDVIRNIRSYIFDLRPRQFAGSLTDALADLAREFRQNSLIDTVARVADDLPPLETESAVALYQIAHESLSNIHKHAKAAHVAISLASPPGRIVMEVQDDGAGFDTALNLPQKHRGMRNMSSRARALGGYLDVHSTPGRGTTVRVELPLEQSSA